MYAGKVPVQKCKTAHIALLLPPIGRSLLLGQVRQGPLDTAIAPGSILVRHADNELFDLLRDPGAAKRMALLASVELLRDKPLVPAQEGVRRGNRRDLFEALTAKRVGQRRKPPAFGVGEPQPAATEWGFEHAIFLLQVGDHLLLVRWIQPAIIAMRTWRIIAVPQGGGRDVIVRSSIHPTSATSMG